MRVCDTRRGARARDPSSRERTPRGGRAGARGGAEVIRPRERGAAHRGGKPRAEPPRRSRTTVPRTSVFSRCRPRASRHAPGSAARLRRTSLPLRLRARRRRARRRTRTKPLAACPSSTRATLRAKSADPAAGVRVSGRGGLFGGKRRVTTGRTAEKYRRLGPGSVVPPSGTRGHLRAARSGRLHTSASGRRRAGGALLARAPLAPPTHRSRTRVTARRPR